MKCPVDGTTLTMADRSGVEIDYCPQCRGVWLDRGELDKILDRADREDDDRPRARPVAAEAPREVYRESRRDDDRRDERPREQPRYDDRKGQHHKRRESWWSDIFDFG